MDHLRTKVKDDIDKEIKISPKGLNKTDYQSDSNCLILSSSSVSSFGNSSLKS